MAVTTISEGALVCIVLQEALLVPVQVVYQVSVSTELRHQVQRTLTRDETSMCSPSTTQQLRYPCVWNMCETLQYITLFSAGSQQVDDVEVWTQVTHDLQLRHQSLSLAPTCRCWKTPQKPNNNYTQHSVNSLRMQ